jgi:predicted flap endonuclease-1-like 5' DNA nuclease
MKQVEAYRIAEADGFRQHPDVYWHQAETAPSSSKAKTPKKSEKDKLTKIEGIGPKIAELLNESGIFTFADLAKAKVGTLDKILKAAGPRFSFHKPNSWPKQARLARDGRFMPIGRVTTQHSPSMMTSAPTKPFGNFCCMPAGSCMTTFQ